MKVGDLVVTNPSRINTRVESHTNRIGFIAYWALSGARLLFTDGKEIWFDADEFTAVSDRAGSDENR